MAFKTRHLRAVPDSPPGRRELHQAVRHLVGRGNPDGLLRWMHVLNGIIRAEREVAHLLKEAKHQENRELVAYLETASDSLAEAKEVAR